MWILFEDVLMLLNQVRPAAAAWCIIHLCARFPISSMLLCTQGRLSPVSGPERPRRPSFLPDGALSSFLLRSNHSLFLQRCDTFHADWNLPPSSLLPCLLFFTLFLGSPRSGLQPLWCFGRWVEAASLMKPAFYSLLHPSPTRSALCFTDSLHSPPPLFFLFISRFSWTPSMWYSVYRHRYGRLFPLWPPRCRCLCHQFSPSLSNQQVGGLLLRGLHGQYRLLINVFSFIPVGK